MQQMRTMGRRACMLAVEDRKSHIASAVSVEGSFPVHHVAISKIVMPIFLNVTNYPK